MNNSNVFPPTRPSRAALALATLGASVLIAGCGSSGSSSTITIGNENTTDNALIKAGETPEVNDADERTARDQARREAAVGARAEARS